MTRQRNDEHSTEFGLWLRKQKEIKSEDGFVATNLDYIWSNYKNGKWLLIEEKRHGGGLSFPQKQQFKALDYLSKADNNYCGFFLIVFENTSPDDGKIWINHKSANVRAVIELLRFNDKALLYYHNESIFS